MRTIHKFILQEETTLHLPEEAPICAVMVQHGKVCLWTEIVVGAPTIERHFQIFPTGGCIPFDTPEATYLYLGTVLMENGFLVWHIYEKINIT